MLLSFNEAYQKLQACSYDAPPYVYGADGRFTENTGITAFETDVKRPGRVNLPLNDGELATIIVDNYQLGPAGAWHVWGHIAKTFDPAAPTGQVLCYDPEWTRPEGTCGR